MATIASGATPTWQSLVSTGSSNLFSGGLSSSPSNVNVAQNSQSSVPTWLQPNLSELQSQYSSIPGDTNNIINPLRSALNNTLSYNTTIGTQAANNAAQEYSNRASQIGGSGEASGVVKAQSLLPVFQQNATASSQEAGVEAQYKFQALNLQSQIAQQLGQLRTSYSNTLANYLTQQRGQDISQATTNQDASLRANLALLQSGTQLSTNPRAQGNYQGSGVTTINGKQYNAGTSQYENATNQF